VEALLSRYPNEGIAGASELAGMSAGSTQRFNRRTDSRQWSVVQLALGMLQMFGVFCSLTLLVETGVSIASLASVVITGLVTTVSILLFQRKPSAR
jgi:hypothetical protein